MVLLVLAFIWAAVLLPPFIRSRLEGSPSDSVGRFRRRLRVLESASPAASSLASDPFIVSTSSGHLAIGMPAKWANEARRLRRLRRRQQVVLLLVGAMATTLFLGLIPGLHIVLVVNVLFDLAFGAYATMLVKSRNAEAQRALEARIAAIHAAAQAEADLLSADGTTHQQAF